ncbi:MAG: DUF1778 domain-containing protein [Zetaproteobacteria bacterium]|nr:DUF1778 domain-containing protein [Zetaproteobacteria bacterium]
MAAKGARIDLRLFSEQKDLITQAAALEGKDASKFVLDNILTKAREVIARESVIELNINEMKRVVEILQQDSSPNATLRKAVERYKKKHG